MPTVDQRIRRARALARMTQTTLAQKVGVKRSAVAQWESPTGTSPSMGHLIAIAQHTGVGIEWLGTGRGQPLLEPATATPEAGEHTLDELEVQCLRALRGMPKTLREKVVAVLLAIVR